jgi:hypothetical protein
VFGAAAAVTGTAGAVLPGIVSPSFASAGSPYALTVAAVGAVPLLFIPLTIGIAILRHRLWDIDVIINRTIVYSALTASVAGIYMVVVGYLGVVFRTGGNLVVSLVAASLVAVLFQPLRERLQRRVNRLMYGERDEPYAVLSRLGRRLEASLEPESVLPTLVEDIARALRLPYVGIWFAEGDKLLLGAGHSETRSSITASSSASWPSPPAVLARVSPPQTGGCYGIWRPSRARRHTPSDSLWRSAPVSKTCSVRASARSCSAARSG